MAECLETRYFANRVPGSLKLCCIDSAAQPVSRVGLLTLAANCLRFCSNKAAYAASDSVHHWNVGFHNTSICTVVWQYVTVFLCFIFIFEEFVHTPVPLAAVSRKAGPAARGFCFFTCPMLL